MGIYIVLDGTRVVGASTRLQGAELIRADEARRKTTTWDGCYTPIYDRMCIVNTELREN